VVFGSGASIFLLGVNQSQLLALILQRDKQLDATPS
jgi:hypothetical protein